MVRDEEFEVRQMFLEEAQEYLNLLEDGLIGLDRGLPQFKQQVDSVLRAAHSLKGGAAMMQFDALSQAAHRLEDIFKFLKSNRPTIDTQVESLFVRSIDVLRQIVMLERQAKAVDIGWLDNFAYPIFTELEDYLKASHVTDAASEFEESEIDVAAMLFETEIESYLSDLEVKLSQSHLNLELRNDLAKLTNDLTSIGEMLELAKFVKLNQAIAQALKLTSAAELLQLAQKCLAAWRQAQALAITGNSDLISPIFDFTPSNRISTVEEDYDSSFDTDDTVVMAVAAEVNQSEVEETSDLFADYDSNLDTDDTVVMAIAAPEVNQSEVEETGDLFADYDSSFDTDDTVIMAIAAPEVEQIGLNLSDEILIEVNLASPNTTIDEFKEQPEYQSVNNVNEESPLDSSSTDLANLKVNKAEETSQSFITHPYELNSQLELVEEAELPFDLIPFDDLDISLLEEDERINFSSKLEKSNDINISSSTMPMIGGYTSLVIELAEVEPEVAEDASPFHMDGNVDELFNQFEAIAEIRPSEQNLLVDESNTGLFDQFELASEPNTEEKVDAVIAKALSAKDSEPNIDLYNNNDEEFRSEAVDWDISIAANSIVSEDSLDIKSRETEPLERKDIQQLSHTDSPSLDISTSESDTQTQYVELINSEPSPKVITDANDEEIWAELDSFLSEPDAATATIETIKVITESNQLKSEVSQPSTDSLISFSNNDAKDELNDLELVNVIEVYDGFTLDEGSTWDNSSDIEDIVVPETNLTVTLNADTLSDLQNTDQPVTFNGRNEHFSNYVSSAPSSNSSLSTSKSAEANTNVVDTLYDLFEYLEGSQDQEYDVASLVKESASDLVTSYLKDTTVRLPINKLDQLHNTSEQVALESNTLDVKLKKLHSFIKAINSYIHDLEEVSTKFVGLDEYSIANSNVLVADNSSNQLPSLEGISSSEVSLSTTPPQAANLDTQPYFYFRTLSSTITETMVRLEEAANDIELTLHEAEQEAISLARGARHLHATVTELRMRPLSDIVDKFPRMLRSLSLQYGKQVSFTVHGDHIQIDRAILDLLNAPLNHLLRNAFDHGIEDAATRAKYGKSEVGNIDITATHHGEKIAITITDDGAGIDVNKIRAKVEAAAIAAGLDTAQIANLSDEKLISLIFEPGFSTAEHVTSLSGRGVGMDVVKTNLKQIGAEITTNTSVGVGTTFTITIPTNLSSMRVLLVESRHLFLAIPSNAIQEVIPYAAEHATHYDDRDFFEWQEKLVPLINPSRYLRLNCNYQAGYTDDKPSKATPAILLLQRESQLLGIQVDFCWGEQEISIRQVEGDIPLPSLFSGCIILGNHHAVPLLNPYSLATFWSETQADTVSLQVVNQESDTYSNSSSTQCILVVDDSINVRRYLSLGLEKAGFRTEQAKDGQEAWQRLSDGLAVDAVVSDIEMPRLDGYGLVAKLRAEPRFKNLPLMMLTSRSSDKHRKLALQLGVNAYFTKPYNEQEIVRAMQQLLENATAE